LGAEMAMWYEYRGIALAVRYGARYAKGIE